MQNVSEHSTSLENTDGGDRQQLKDDADNNSFSANDRKSSRKRKQEEVYEQGGDDGKEDTSSLKKPRVVWSFELHQKFVDALNHIGIHKAVPKNILERMNVPGLTRDNIASHLQKYRIYLRHQGHTNRSFATAPDPTFGPVSALNGFDLQALAVAGQLRAPSLAQLQAAGLGKPSSLTNPGVSVSPLVDQRNVFSFENSETRFGHGHGHGHGHGQMMNSGGCGGNRQMSLLHDVPTGHMRVHQQQIVGQNVQSSGMLMPVRGGLSMLPSLGQQQPVLSSSVSRRNDLTDAVGVRNSNPETRSSRVLPATHSVFDNFPLASAQGVSVPYQEELTSSDAKGSSLSAATVTTTRFGLNDWDLRNVGMVFDSHQNTAEATSVEAEHVQSHYQQQQQPAPSTSLNHMNQIYMNGGSVRVKSEKVVETETFPIATTLFGQQYNQEDLVSPLLNFDGNSIK